jgi:hypothetical protein
MSSNFPSSTGKGVRVMEYKKSSDRIQFRIQRESRNRSGASGAWSLVSDMSET